MPLPSETPDRTENPPTKARTRSRVIVAVVLVAVGLAARRPLLPYPGFMHDQDQFVVWAHVAATTGLAGVYERYDHNGRLTPLCNYPPVQVYVCRALASIYPMIAGKPLDDAAVAAIIARNDTPEVRAAYVLFKLPAVFADLITVVLLVLWLSRKWSLLFAGIVSALYALHPAVLHDSSVWGQIDSIPTLLLLGAFEAARRKKLNWMWAWATIAALTKPQTLIFFPVWLMLSILQCRTDGRRWLRATWPAVALVAVMLAPLYGSLGGVREAYIGAPNYYPFTHLNGFSAWIIKDPLLESGLEDNLLNEYVRDDRPLVFGVSPRTLGLIGVVLIWWLAIDVIRRRRGDEWSIEWGARLLPLGFFVLSTQMHERYLFSAIALWAWSARPTWRWWTGWLVLGAVVAINMLWVWIGPCSGDALRIQQELFHRPWLGQPPGVWCSAALIALLLASMIRIWQLKNPT